MPIVLQQSEACRIAELTQQLAAARRALDRELARRFEAESQLAAATRWLDASEVTETGDYAVWTEDGSGCLLTVNEVTDGHPPSETKGWRFFRLPPDTKREDGAT